MKGEKVNARALFETLPESSKALNRHLVEEKENSEVRMQKSESRIQNEEVIGPRSRGRCPNKTEAEYQRFHLRGMDARYEGLTFRMANGHRYTPDWVVFVDGKPVACHECKGGYALQSQQRARLAFDQARVEFPWVKWVWAVKTVSGWRVEG